MGKYQAYPEYKNSGVEWLEDLPNHWEVKRTKAMFGLARQLVGKNSKDYQLLSLTLKGVIPRDISDGGGKIPAEFDTYQVVRPKNLIFCLFDIDETPRTIGISPYDGMITGAYNVYSALEPCVPEYAYYYFMHIDSFKGLKPFYTGLRKVVRSETFSNIKMPVPRKEEQEIIANFLDHETAKIDTLIEKQQQLIKLLKEKRQAVISHAVTKGLNPNAPMRDSGVEWLGEVPEHWAVSKVKFEYKNLDGRRIPLSTEERSYMQGEHPYYGASGVIDHVDDYIFDENLVLVSEDGANLLMRSYAIAFPAYGKYWVNNHAHILKPRDGNTEFWAEVIEVRDLTPYISGSAQPKFTSEALSNLVIAVPPATGEVNKISSYIREQKEKYSLLIGKAEGSIKLMQERRTALISAAVTGKIDVRNWQAPESSNKEVAA
ncbi:restriction endonuclease subunit S [Dasania sp. GY-MA-18]|uniref:Restriction endonuclease subunit S n=1 Tax=Dasania phycosphaerae TaxID=2950436 RepID=A0A9J6RLM3_9GAMM|nr:MULTISPECIES: restriction endonuclease subunit S [Dasania]MCR8923190.1 restriction endonuclease subunit S [Dasania sp. GY-MA-18]MCZ0865622.1 restriction endonuclease subunit S [Dasania phycosphaerae]MCZ0869347.1 restriction endonuclease subunit S [Dasania phycosphaerae]